MRERAANVQRQHLKDFRKPRELLLKTALSYKKICLEVKYKETKGGSRLLHSTAYALLALHVWMQF